MILQPYMVQCKCYWVQCPFPLFRFQLTFPNGNAMPAHFSQFALFLPITLLVPANLFHPEIMICFLVSCSKQNSPLCSYPHCGHAKSNRLQKCKCGISSIPHQGVQVSPCDLIYTWNHVLPFFLPYGYKAGCPQAGLATQFSYWPDTIDALSFIEETSERIILKHYLTDMWKWESADQYWGWCYEFRRRCRWNCRFWRRCRWNLIINTGFIRQYRMNWRAYYICDLRIKAIKSSGRKKQSLVQSFCIHTFFQTLQQLVAILGPIAAILLVLHNIVTNFCGEKDTQKYRNTEYSLFSEGITRRRIIMYNIFTIYIIYI